MLNGLPSMAAAVVIRRRNPSWDGRTNAINPSCWRHQLRATRLWGCSGAERASQTLMSGMTSPAGMKSWNCLWELDELIDLFIGHVEFASRGWNQRLIEVEPPLRPGWRGLLDGLFNSSQHQLARGAPLARGCLVQPAVQIPRKVDGCADGVLLHASLCTERLK